MSSSATVIALLIVLAAAHVYVRRAKHPQLPLMAAFLVFVTVFGLAAAALYALLTSILGATGHTGALENPLAAVVFVLTIGTPAFLLARWQVKRPPGRQQLPH